ncbi:BZ3500_MvSof-1268-A1-R1_Chr3-1g05569 [Microbotryum saponariae]|uniref:BZ3500_MvSof-1268-A1-R1_Chr3-1g05569 protein n=1 Tax=Microbotryum saponariae TaxID=289078 RepID=A0A2X0KX63_9BASI|nr:BZ3500_MvSof-1268-A1-R1_Chr3-1g05569 [Microbotryum saponariae]SDA04759.1 BZ3501_MvSof-1269-A2-R1_Chr3-1g05239 [Microbotryum saponariae]
MKSLFITTALLASRVALTIPASFLIQTPGNSALLNSPGPPSDQQQPPQQGGASKVRVSFEHSVESIIDQLKDSIDVAKDELADIAHPHPHPHPHSYPQHSPQDAADSESAASPPWRKLPPHHPPAYLDFSNYTIIEILNATLHHHHDDHDGHDDPEGRHGSDSDSQRRGAESDDGSESGGAPHAHSRHDDPAFLPLQRLAWLVNRSSEALASLDKKGITLLAPDDRALTPPHRRGGAEHPPRRRGPRRQNDKAQAQSEAAESADRPEDDDELMAQPLVHPIYHVQRSLRQLDLATEWNHRVGESGNGDNSDEDDEKRRKRFEHIVAYILKYHTLPSELSGRELASSSTVETDLNTSRVKVEPSFALFPHPYRTIKFNGYASKKLTVKAKNGLIHLIGAPLLPPLSPLNGLFLFPQAFSTLTSDLQKVDLAESLLPHYHHSAADADVEEQESSSPSSLLMDQLVDEIVKENNLTSFTVFAPTNWAFTQLGPKIVALLHSPFPISKRVLKYILSYHVVPDVVFYSDFVRGARPSAGLDRFIVSESHDVDVPLEWVMDEPRHWIAPRSDVNALPDLPKFPFPKMPEHRGPPGAPGRGPLPPPRRGGEHDDPHHPPPHHKASVTRYELPTLLTGENKNATLKVLSVAFRRFGRGPVRRAVIVLPNHSSEHGHGQDGVDEFTVYTSDTDSKPNHIDCPHRRGPPPAHPVKVFRTDVPARNGAVQVVNKLLRPPMPHHDSPSFGKPATQHRRFLGSGMAALFD